MGYLQDAELGLPWEGKPIETVLAECQAQNARLWKALAEAERAARAKHDAWLDAINHGVKMETEREAAIAALRALAKEQYDGTVEGLRYQIEKEDWGDVLDIEKAKAAYELTLAALAANANPTTAEAHTEEAG